MGQETGADIAIADIEGWTPLNSASLSGHVDVVKLLLEKGADVTAARTDGRTPLNSASFRKEFLLLFGHKGSG